MEIESEKGELSEPYSGGKRAVSAKAKDVKALEERMDSFSSNMKELVQGFKNQMKVLADNQTTLTKTLVAMRSGGEGGGADLALAGAGSGGGDGGSQIANTILRGVMNKGSGGNVADRWVAMMMRESMMMNRTIRLGMMKRLDITDLMLGDDTKAMQFIKDKGMADEFSKL